MCSAGLFLVNNYYQALEILDTEEVLEASMKQRGIADPSIFVTWLEEEKDYIPWRSTDGAGGGDFGDGLLRSSHQTANMPVSGRSCSLIDSLTFYQTGAR